MMSNIRMITMLLIYLILSDVADLFNIIRSTNKTYFYKEGSI